MSKFWQQLMTVWGKLEIAQRATIVLAGLGILAVLAVVAYAGTRPDYRTLASGLSKAQANEIAAYLEEARVAFRIEDNGSTIMVPAQDVYRLGNELAQKEMLGDGSKGYELLGKQSSMWQTTFSEHKTYDRALAGELERFFKELPNVRSARVLIDRPQPSPFLGDDSAKPKASVKLDMKPGTRLSERQLAGVIHLCAGAVAGLAPDRVEVMDGSGLLTRKADDPGAGMAQTTLEAEMARETWLTRKAQEQLDAVFGPGRSQVRVSVKLDFTKRSEATSDPTGKMLLEERSTTSDEKGEQANAGAVAGTQPNVEGETRTAAAEPLKTSKVKEEVDNKYVVGTRKVTTEDEVGRIRGMTVSILIPQKKTLKPKLDEQGKPSDAKEEVLEEFPQPEKDRIKALVLDAIGFNSAKDLAAKLEGAQSLDARFTASLQSLELYREEETPVAQAGISLPIGLPLQDAIGYGLAALVGLAVLLIARGQLKRSHQAWAAAEARTQAAQKEAETKDQAETGEGATPEDKEQVALRARREDLKEAIKKRIMEDPASAAQVLRHWMFE